MSSYLWITTDGTWAVAEATPETSYELISKGVDGYIEHVTLSPRHRIHGVDFWANEEGRLMGLPVNPIGSVLYDGIIAGNIVLTGGCDEEGETLGLSDAEIERLVSVLKLAPEKKGAWPRVH